MTQYSSYGTKELIQWLNCLGYKREPQVGSSHLKYTCPNKLEKGQVTFILVIQNRREYDPYWQREYPKQMRKHGFSADQIDGCSP